MLERVGIGGGGDGYFFPFLAYCYEPANCSVHVKSSVLSAIVTPACCC